MSTVIAVTQRGGRFLAHLGEMCLAMCVGAVILNLMVFRGAALIGYPDLYQRFPELSTLWIALTLSVPMAAWMRFRGHDWRPTLEMSGATIVVWVLLIGIYWLGILPKTSLLEWQLSLACPVMAAVMLLRFNLYSGQMSHGRMAQVARPA